MDRCRSPPPFTRRTAGRDAATGAPSATLLVSWDEPLFSDNSHGPVTVSQSHRPPTELPVGTTRVQYTATDQYANNASCVIDLVVQGRPGLLFLSFASAAVAVVSSHMTASSSASWSRFSPPSSCVNGHVSTMWFMVCRWPQSQEGDWARPHLCKLARHGP